MVTAQSTPRTVTAKSGAIIPCTIDQSTDLDMVCMAATVYYKSAGCKGSFDTIMRVAEAMRDSSAVVVLYVGADLGHDARVLWPNSITLTKDMNIVCKAYCTLRREWKTFRIDRMLTCHALTTPDDIESEMDA